MRGEHHLYVLGPREALERLRHVLSNGVEEIPILPPAPDQRRLDRLSALNGVENLLLISPDGHARIVGRHHNTDETIMPSPADLCDGVLDVGMPVPHPHIRAKAGPERALDARRLGARVLQDG